MSRHWRLEFCRERMQLRNFMSDNLSSQMPRSPRRPDDSLLAFYAGVGTDSEGRYIGEILAWDDDQLEYCHDYIQWLFPTDQPSAFNFNAPRVLPRHREEFSRRAELRENLIHGLRRMLAFYGLEYHEERGQVHISRSVAWTLRKGNWLTPRNHNHLRLTRILTSLRLLGLPDHARALFLILDEIAQSDDGAAISSTSRAFWKSATER